MFAYDDIVLDDKAKESETLFWNPKAARKNFILFSVSPQRLS